MKCVPLKIEYADFVFVFGNINLHAKKGSYMKETSNANLGHQIDCKWVYVSDLKQNLIFEVTDSQTLYLLVQERQLLHHYAKLVVLNSNFERTVTLY